MGTSVQFVCDGCDAKAEARLRSEFVSVSGRNYGFGARVEDKASDVAPDGWVAFDPYTGCTYCPKCWADIQCECSRTTGTGATPWCPVHGESLAESPV